MAGRSFIFLLLGFILNLTFVKTDACDQPFNDPNDARVTLTYTSDVDITTITLQEEYEDVTIALPNCNNLGQMIVTRFTTGSNSTLGLIINDDGSLVVGMKQDYETLSNQAYTILIRLSDSEPRVTTISLSILNEDDNAPTIAPYGSSSCLVDESLGVGKPTKCYFLVKDVDGIGIPDKMSFQVTDLDKNSDTFTLEKSSGEEHCDGGDSIYCMTTELFLQEALLYYDNPVYSLKVEAKDPANNTGSLAIVVQVNPENTESPVITPDSCDVKINESYAGVLDIPNLMVNDKDSLEYGQFNIDLKSENDCARAFSVIPSVGYRNASLKISVIDPSILDFEDVTCQIIVSTLTATEVADPSHIGTSTITVSLIDLNDETPVFTKSSYEMKVKEHEEMDHVIGSVIAEDADAGDIVTYDLTGSTQLKIDSRTGEISVNDTSIDYERLKKIFLTVTAEDLANHITYATVTVTVTDVNDEPPEIKMPLEQPEVDEDTPIGTKMDKIIITATDPDTNPDLLFDIDWTQSRAIKNGVTQDLDLFKDCFSCTTSTSDNKTWKLSLRLDKSLDWGSYDTLYISITVEDKNTVLPDFENSSTSSATLTVKIKDVNNNPPVFPSSIGPLSLKENTEPNKLIGNAVATDADGPGNNDISYSIVILDRDEEFVNISSKGEISTGKDNVDYELVQTFDCRVTASDGLNHGSIDITVNVEDVNDHSPKINDGFTDPILVEENTDNFTVLRLINATDDDLSSTYNTLHYELKDSLFGINQTGWVYLPDGMGDKLDYEQTKTLTAQVIVRDRCEPTCLSDSTNDKETLTFMLVDVNDNPPEFKNVGDPFAEVTEDKRKDDAIAVVEATDQDTGDMGKITFTIIDVISDKNEHVDMFDIKDNGDNKTATIYATKDFTEAWGKYTVTVNASDCAEPFHEISYDFKIVVDDVNNHYPEFVFPTDGTKIRLDKMGSDIDKPLVDTQTENTIVIQAVDDKDFGTNGTSGIIYSVIGDETAKEYLEINSNGFLYLLKKFEDVPIKTFTLTSEACDAKGDETLQKCTQKDAEVILRITQEFEPTFDVNVLEISFTENTTGLSEENNIPKATDLNNEDNDDCDPNCQGDDTIYYFITQNSEDKFIFENNTIPVLKLKSMLDREEKANHTIIICVTNHPDGPRGEVDDKSKLQVTVIVIDVIDTAPVFSQTLFAAGINIGDIPSPQNIVAQFTATDGDERDELTYSIVENSFSATDKSIESFANVDSFPLDGKTGDLTLNFSPQSSMSGIFKFDVQVVDKGGFSAVTKAQVYIISDDNIVTITFKNSYEYTLTKKPQIEEILSQFLKNKGNVKNLATSNEASTDVERTDASIYFINTATQVPINKNDINRQLNDGTTYKNLTDALLYQENLVLEGVIQSDGSTLASDDGVAQTVLIVVSAVLGTLVLVLFAAFFLRTRSLNRRLEALSTTKFGSQDSGLNRVGVAVPNTNRHAVEGSNPVWGNEDVGSRDFDNMSDTSGDSDLIGIEENPEFSPYSRSGISNSGFTPDIEEGRRISVNPLVGAGFDRGAGLNPLSADFEDFGDESNKRRESVNPLAVSRGNFKNDRPSETTMGDDNFSFVPRPPITDL